jgi:hypothetical protein
MKELKKVSTYFLGTRHQSNLKVAGSCLEAWAQTIPSVSSCYHCRQGMYTILWTRLPLLPLSPQQLYQNVTSSRPMQLGRAMISSYGPSGGVPINMPLRHAVPRYGWNLLGKLASIGFPRMNPVHTDLVSKLASISILVGLLIPLIHVFKKSDRRLLSNLRVVAGWSTSTVALQIVKRRRKGNPVPRGITGQPCSWGI